jgi:TRAP-type C4-dicarboxylate transport system substrate-binding protein
MQFRVVSVVAALAVAALAGGCGSSASERAGQKPEGPAHVLTMLKPIGDGEELAYFASEVERLSKGTLRIRLVPSGYSKRPDFEAATIRDVQHGRGDLAFAGTRAWDQFGVHRMSALMAPLLVDSYALEERVLGGDLARQMLSELRPLGLVGIGILPGGMRHPFAASKRLGGPADYRGLTIGTQESRVADATMRVLGANPVRVPADTLGLKGVEGLEQRVFVLYGNRLAVPGSHITANVNLWPRPLVIFAGADAYKRLTAGERDVLQQAATNAVPKAGPAARSYDLDAAGNLCRTGRVAFDPASTSELRALRRAVAPVYRELESDPETRATIQQIESLKAQLAEPPVSLPKCAGRSATRAGAPTALDGVWRMDTDPSAAGREGLDENWGHWIFVFDHGKFADTQENPKACTWGYGTFAVRGNQTSWNFTDGGGIAPNNAMNKPGEFFVFDLSSYRDTLTLKPVPGEISPVNFRAKPWRRLSSTPSRRFFSKRCPPPAEALPG